MDRSSLFIKPNDTREQQGCSIDGPGTYSLGSDSLEVKLVQNNEIAVGDEKNIAFLDFDIINPEGKKLRKPDLDDKIAKAKLKYHHIDYKALYPIAYTKHAEWQIAISEYIGLNFHQQMMVTVYRLVENVSKGPEQRAPKQYLCKFLTLALSIN